MENSDTKISSASPRSASQTPPSSATAASSWFSSLVRSRSSNAMVVAPTSPCRDAGPVNNKHQFHGVMFKYGPKPIQAGKYQLIFFIYSFFLRLGNFGFSLFFLFDLIISGIELNNKRKYGIGFCGEIKILKWHALRCNFLQVAFKIGDYKQQVIFIGGLKEGILAAE